MPASPEVDLEFAIRRCRIGDEARPSQLGEATLWRLTLMVPIDQKRCRTLIRASAEVRLSLAVGKTVGSRYMQSYVVLHPATTKFFANSFIFKKQIEKEGLPGDSRKALKNAGERYDQQRTVGEKPQS